MGCRWHEGFSALPLNTSTTSVPAGQNGTYSSNLLWCISLTLSKKVFNMCQNSIDCIIVCLGSRGVILTTN